MDEDVRRAIRERDARPGDVGAAVAAARLVARGHDREAAARAWHEVVRRDALDVVAREALADLKCELVPAPSSTPGVEEFESTVDRSRFVRVPGGRTSLLHPPAATTEVAGFFVTREPIAYERFQQFLVRAGGATRERVESWILLAHGPLRRGPLGSFKLRAEARASYVVDASWHGARAYALWAHGDLPTSAQWEAFTYGLVAAGAARPARSPCGVTGDEALAQVAGGGEWVLDRQDALGVEQRLVRTRVAAPGAGPAGATFVEPASFPGAGFRVVRPTWWRP